MTLADTRTINVVEHNPYHPRPFVMTEVARCLVDAIRAAGYASEHLVNATDPAAFSIVLGGSPDLEQKIPGLQPRSCAIFNLEQLGSTSSLVSPEYLDWLRDWLVLDYHASNIAFLRQRHGASQQALELPLVPGPSLLAGSDVTPEPNQTVDVLFYGTMSERRQAVIDQLQAMGLSVEIVAGAYAEELEPAVQRARLVLHTHFYSTSLFPIARMLQPVMRGVPIVCENSVFSPLGDWSVSGILFAPYEQLSAACAALLQNPAEMASRAQSAQTFAHRIDFKTPFDVVVTTLRRQPEWANTRAPTGEDGSPLLTNAEIETILAEEALHPPEAGQGVPVHTVVQREPGQGRFGRWIPWIMIAFILMGAINVLHRW